ncbi:hypothetical protein [Nocardia sp. BSTN01]|uniref:hypothetical protein n=1 Tax=Nocardia sp. BSTN01 TaxID=2783665 RepID=UPI001E2F4F87|nr:hypothetical protein [Nocardia sp. BSTN01]
MSVNRGPAAAAENRAALLAAAREVFAAYGADAPLWVIAQRAGVRRRGGICGPISPSRRFSSR